MIHRRLLQLAGAIPGTIAVLAVCGIVLSALHLTFAITLGSAIAALIVGDGDPVRAFAILAAVTVARGVVIWMRELVAARAGAAVRIRLRRRLLGRLSAVPVAERDSGAAAAVAIDGVEGLDPYFTRYLPQLIVVFVVPAIVVVLVWERSAAAGLILAVAAAIAVFAPRAWDARLLTTGRTRWARFARLSSGYVEALQQIPLLRAFGASGRAAERLANEAEGLRELTMAQLRLSLVVTVVGGLAMHLGTVLATLAAIAAVASGEASAVGAVVVLMLARECFRPVLDLAENWHAGYLGLTAVDGLERLLTARPDIVEDGAHDRPAPVGEFELDAVSFRYPGAEPAVADLSLRVAPGETVALIGASGSGKSTVARLLERDVDPEAGVVRVGGRDLREYTPGARSRSVVVVPQDPVLFTWSVRENLRLHRADAADAEVERAARAAGIHHVICALPDGYDTVLAENGEQLSGGQCQRLAIARALLSPAPVLVFDEVTSALDLETERAVVDALAREGAGRTMLLIAHRESACVHATRWVGLDAGRVVASGDGAPSGRAFARVAVR
ncbi:ABC transporter ATP-binding protein/permease [Microbacterium sp. G2-8]|uniref:ABC transporter ATP-binding protein/permease n=1 Tax=Microbacterium sp. G2-8 TaxID=2842454 RepID=UPI001C898A3D|nr:ATP-binding cassette domain-containing protein [Microbacterium sp. G2-8]